MRLRRSRNARIYEEGVMWRESILFVMSCEWGWQWPLGLSEVLICISYLLWLVKVLVAIITRYWLCRCAWYKSGTNYTHAIKLYNMVGRCALYTAGRDFTSGLRKFEPSAPGFAPLGLLLAGPRPTQHKTTAPCNMTTTSHNCDRFLVSNPIGTLS